MAKITERVGPGDLITANFMNRILVELGALEDRVEALETIGPGSDKVIITEPNPLRTFHIGDELKIVGKNFGLPSQNIVLIEAERVDKFKAGSNDELLIIDIPVVQNIPQEGRLVTLTVSNTKGFASTQFELAQPAITKPSGTFVVTLVGSPTEPKLEAGKSYFFTYKITAITTLDETYALAPSIDLGWSAEYVDSSDQPIKPSEIFIPKGPIPTVGTVVNARVKVTIPAGMAENTVGQLRLTVTSKRNPTELNKSSENNAIKVGGAPPQADKISISLSGVFSPGSKAPNGDMVIPATGNEVGATFKAIVPTAGRYKIFTPTFVNNPGNLWSARVVGATTGVFMSPPESSFSIAVKAQPGAAATDMTLKVASEDDASIFGDEQQKVRPA